MTLICSVCRRESEAANHMIVVVTKEQAKQLFNITLHLPKVIMQVCPKCKPIFQGEIKDANLDEFENTPKLKCPVCGQPKQDDNYILCNECTAKSNQETEEE